MSVGNEPVSFGEPAVLWRLRHPNGDRARATIIPGTPASTLIYFVNDAFERGENFTEWEPALAEAEAVRVRMRQEGWLDD
jgi:hypothetical protein